MQSFILCCIFGIAGACLGWIMAILWSGWLRSDKAKFKDSSID